MEPLPLPSKISITADARKPHHATVIIEPCYPGYGTTLGNALRRVLLSSLPGAAVTKVKMKGVDHEFSTLPNVQEDVVDILLNIKQMRVALHEGTSATLTLHAKGEKEVTACDCTGPSSVDILDKDLVLATLNDKSAELEMELTVEQGRGYVPVEAQQREKTEIGVIALDAIYTPVRNVNFATENMRVGQMTNYDRLTLDISTDGTISPADAFRHAADILAQHFSLLKDAALEDEPKTRKKKSSEEPAPAEAEA